jgi:beta-lactamase regulating signal transducer with metallopeptidase domain
MNLLCFSYNLNHAIGWTVVHSLWQAFVVAIITGIALIILQKKTARTRYLVANIGLLSVLIAAAVTFSLYYDFSKQAGEVVFIADPSTSVLSEKSIEAPALSTPSATNFERGMTWQGMKNYCNNNMYLIVSVWFMGMVFFLLKLLGNISYIYYLKNRLNFPAEEYWQDLLDKLREKTNLTQYIMLVESALVRSPLVVGHIKPMILFPIGAINRLNTNEVEAILAHELAHVMRHDYLFNILQSLIEALFYFHPAVWWLSSQIRTERENCCDDIAMELCGNPLTYAKALVSVQEMAYFSTPMAMAFAGNNRKKQLLLRVQRVLHQPKSKINIMEKFIATSILLLLVAGLAFGGGRYQNDGSIFSKGLNILTEKSDNQENIDQQKNYIKYTVNGELDSLPVDKAVKDGQYNFNSNLYEVNMTVKNQHVTAFQINGLEVDRKDMPKFEKMINELVSAKKEEEPVLASTNTDDLSFLNVKSMRNYHCDATNVEVNNDGDVVSYLGDGKITIDDADGTVSTLTIDENGGRFLLIKKRKGEPTTVSLSEDNKIIKIGGITSNLAALRQLGWTVTDKGIQPIGGFRNIQPPPAPPMPPSPPAHAVPPMPPTPPTPPAEAYSLYRNNSAKKTEECVARFQKEINKTRELSNKAARDGVKARELQAINRELAEIEADLRQNDVDFSEIEQRINDAEETINQSIAVINEQRASSSGEGGTTTSSSVFSYSTHSDDDDNVSRRTSSKKDGKRTVTSHDGNEEDPFNQWLERELVKDGYIKTTKSYNFVWTNAYMKVAGKKVSDEHRKKYVRKHKEMTGNEMGDDFHITRNVENN